MARPNIPDGWLGAQVKMSELKIATDSHTRAEFQVKGDNNVKVKFKTGKAVKVVTKFTQCATERDLPEMVFVQRKNKESLQVRVGFPDNGFYKLQLFALEESDSNESLPNVYNYLIEVSGSHRPAVPYPKAYTKFFVDCCELDAPKVLNETSDDLSKVKFDLKVPGAVKVAIHCVEEWFHLESKGGDAWEGKADLSKYKGQDSKVTVNANYDKNSNSFSVLLEFRI